MTTTCLIPGIERRGRGHERDTEFLPLIDGLVNPTALEHDLDRLSGQNKIIFKRLLRGPATNRKLAELSGTLNLSGRLSDVRQEVREHHWDLVILKRSRQGLNWYALKRPDGTIHRQRTVAAEARPESSY